MIYHFLYKTSYFRGLLRFSLRFGSNVYRTAFSKLYCPYFERYCFCVSDFCLADATTGRWNDEIKVCFRSMTSVLLLETIFRGVPWNAFSTKVLWLVRDDYYYSSHASLLAEDEFCSSKLMSYFFQLAPATGKSKSGVYHCHVLLRLQRLWCCTLRNA